MAVLMGRALQRAGGQQLGDDGLHSSPSADHRDLCWTAALHSASGEAVGWRQVMLVGGNH